MIITTTDFIPHHEISDTLGIARGSTVRARNVARDFFAAFKNIIGGARGSSLSGGGFYKGSGKYLVLEIWCLEFSLYQYLQKNNLFHTLNLQLSRKISKMEWC